MTHLKQTMATTKVAVKPKHFPLTRALIEGLLRIELCTPVTANFRKEVM